MPLPPPVTIAIFLFNLIGTSPSLSSSQISYRFY